VLSTLADPYTAESFPVKKEDSTMPNHRTTEENESPQFEADDWEVCLEPYEGHHHEAIGLACRFIMLREYLDSKRPKITKALAAIDAAIEELYTHTDFPKGSYALYRTRIEGEATLDDERLIESLGIEF
jgi:hypothetical protein